MGETVVKVLVTGGGGYLGTVLVRELQLQRYVDLELDYTRVVDRFSWGTQALAALAEGTDGFEVVAGSITDPSVLDQALVDMDAVVHLAGIVGYPACDADPDDAEQTNVEGTRLLCDRMGSRRLIFGSTGSSYGKVEGICTEQTPISPLTRYGRTKAQGEAYVKAAGGVSLRFATLYGLSPRMRWDLLPHNFAQKGVQGEIRVFDGDARRTFLHVEDAARAIVFALTTDLPDPVYNVGSEAYNLTKREVAQKVQALTGCRIVPCDGQDLDARDYEVSYAAIRQAGWQAIYPFDLSPIVQWARVWR